MESDGKTAIALLAIFVGGMVIIALGFGYFKSIERREAIAAGLVEEKVPGSNETHWVKPDTK